ncbi:WecB/TagA/CpsF family glycosyltransferase [Leptothrix discophora]|uniref:WecB/TagA/CpsF family glycosyltransferase n=1 Tax=Leptothrix discophora TaxID=89 RepID=A0ABT9G8K6_LEPDI|nr:WecB/TagA/CpsF family glycosyltransferase [Leptothrix discophora]MDP4302811.1 WecB/TagA/CpsF family glycosyltransferase [Leptothrix discophora]
MPVLTMAPAAAPPRPRRTCSRATFAMWADGLLLLDPLAVLLAGWWVTAWFVPGRGPAVPGDAALLVWAAAMAAPFLLFDRHFGRRASLGREADGLAALLGTHLIRLALLAALLGLLAWTGAGARDPADERLLPWLVLLMLAVTATTLLARLAYIGLARLLLRHGRLSETVAVVGAGASAQRLVERLRAMSPRIIDVLGVYDDGPVSHGRTVDGSIAQLLRLGRERHIDWVVLSQPPGHARRVRALTQRLQALSAPITLSSPGTSVEDHAPWSAATGRVGHHVPIRLMPVSVPSAVAVEPSLPRAAPKRWPALAYSYDDHDLDSFSALAAAHGQHRYGYVVTPNADHLIRLRDDAGFRALYADASHILNDSRVVAHILSLTRNLRLPVCTGSDLTARLFERVIAPDDAIVLIGATPAQAELLRQRHGLTRLAHHNPPMGFIRDPAQVEACLRFVEAHSPFRFALLAVGSPQQEILAQRLKQRDRARGLALCIGASIDFLTGVERRAPAWMGRAGLEWLHRLLMSPTRLAGRYLVRGPRVFGLLRDADIVLRQRVMPPGTVALPEPWPDERPGHVAAVLPARAA